MTEGKSSDKLDRESPILSTKGNCSFRYLYHREIDSREIEDRRISNEQ